MDAKPIKIKESLHIIGQMTATAKNDQRNNDKGWIVYIAGKEVQRTENHAKKYNTL